MSARYKVIWAATAADDLADIVAHVANDSPTNALRVLEEIKQASLQLYHLPSILIKPTTDSPIGFGRRGARVAKTPR